MDEAIVPNQPQQPIIEPKQPFAPPARSVLLIAGVTIIILFGLVVAWSVFRPKEVSGPPGGPSPSPAPPSTARSMRPFATSSAFLSVESSVASLSGVISSYSVEDSTIAPPTIDLPLGFNP
ncbi:hypothetical protein HY031_00140 [Candidatus Gottesmanbacteria bacterium]|nr:hypothetical protein [Candidatus Gottesmanbacteria bacterium]